MTDLMFWFERRGGYTRTIFRRIPNWCAWPWQEATYHAAHALARLVPFMHGHNKIWMMTPSHAGAYLDAARVRRRARVAVEHRGQRAVIAARVKWVEALRMDSIPCIMPVVARDATAGNRYRAVDGTGRTHTHAINPAHINHLHVTDTSTFAECPF